MFKLFISIINILLINVISWSNILPSINNNNNNNNNKDKLINTLEHINDEKPKKLFANKPNQNTGLDMRYPNITNITDYQEQLENMQINFIKLKIYNLLTNQNKSEHQKITVINEYNLYNQYPIGININNGGLIRDYYIDFE